MHHGHLAGLAARSAVAGAVLNVPWELAHMSLYGGGSMSFRDHVVCCGIASLGDAVGVAIIAMAGALLFRSTQWHRSPTAGRVAVAVALGAAIAVVVERVALATGWWSYGPNMPRILGTTLGLSPLVQFAVTPALAVFVGVPLLERGRDAWRSRTRNSDATASQRG